MPRKPTPKILNEPVEVPPDEATIPPVENTPAAIVESVAEQVVEATPEVEVVVEQTPSSTEVQEETPPAPATEEAAEPEEGAEPEMTAPVPVSRPLRKPMRTLILASLGAISYAVEEAEFIIRKLVERGELTQKEGMKMMGKMTRRSRAPSKPGEAAGEGKEAEPAPTETKSGMLRRHLMRRMGKAQKAGTAEATGEAEPDELASAEEANPEEEEIDFKPRDIVTVNILSFGSPVMIEPGKKPKK